MSELSEEEIIIDAKEFINNIKEILNEGNNDLTKKVETDFYTLQVVLQGLLDLYNKEKETSHFIQSQLDIANAKLIEEKEKNIKLQKRNDRQVKIINKRDKNIEELKEIANKDWEERCRLTFELENCINKEKIREEIKKEMKYLYVDSCAEDSGKYTAYMNVLNLLEEE